MTQVVKAEGHEGVVPPGGPAHDDAKPASERNTRSEKAGWRGSRPGRAAPLRRPLSGMQQDFQGAFVEGLGLGVAALGPVEFRQVAQDEADIGMLRPQGLLGDGERALV